MRVFLTEPPACVATRVVIGLGVSKACCQLGVGEPAWRRLPDLKVSQVKHLLAVGVLEATNAYDLIALRYFLE